MPSASFLFPLRNLAKVPTCSLLLGPKHVPVGRSFATTSKSPARQVLPRTANCVDPVEATIPPGYKARIGNLQTFSLPEKLTRSPGDVALGRALIDAWRKDGILQISMDAINRNRFRM